MGGILFGGKEFGSYVGFLCESVRITHAWILEISDRDIEAGA